MACSQYCGCADVSLASMLYCCLGQKVCCKGLWWKKIQLGLGPSCVLSSALFCKEGWTYGQLLFSLAYTLLFTPSWWLLQSNRTRHYRVSSGISRNHGAGLSSVQHGFLFRWSQVDAYGRIQEQSRHV